MSLDTNFKHSYKREKQKTIILSGLIIFCCISAPLSFSFLIQMKTNPILAFSAGMTFVFALFIFAYFRLNALKNMETKYNQIHNGMKLKKKQSGSMYEVVQQSHNFFYLKDSVGNRKTMVSKEKLRSDFDLEL